MLQEINKHKYSVRQIDGAEGMLLLPDKSIKLVYGSPPYPNAEREYGVWRSSEYIEKITPFLDAACRKLRDDGFIVINVKANREKSTAKVASKRSLVIEKLAIVNIQCAFKIKHDHSFSIKPTTCGEHIVHIDGVTGSSPVQTTKIPPDKGGFLIHIS